MHFPSSMTRRTVLMAAAASVAAPALRAQTLPRTIRLVVPFPPGGSPDILARALQPRLAAALGVNVVIDNKPGAGGSLGATDVARSAPNGATLLMGHTGTLAVNPAIYPGLAYDPQKSFAPIAWVARVPNVLVINSSLPITTLKQLIERAKAQPGQLTHASGGNGSAAHIAFEYLKQRAGMFMLHIPYRGTAPSITDVIGGRVDCTFTGAPAVLQHVQGGRLRALAVSSPQRLPALPNVPTVAESGYPGFEADQWYGVVGPAGMAPELVVRLNAEINAALVHPEVLEPLTREGATPMPSKPQDFAALIAREIPRWAEVVRVGNVKPS